MHRLSERLKIDSILAKRAIMSKGVRWIFCYLGSMNKALNLHIETAKKTSVLTAEQ